MATNKHAMIRYQALDKCFQRRSKEYHIDDLVEECNKAIYEFTGVEDGVKRRTIFSDIRFMESSQGWNAPIHREYVGRSCFYYYDDPDFSINKKDFSEAELDKIDEALVMLNRFKGAEGFDWIDEFITNFEDKLGRQRNTVPVIGYERNPYLKGIGNLSVLYNHIINKRVLKITYLHFTKGEKIHIFHPYYLKEYNNRWFLLGITDKDKDVLTNLPLDRIDKIEPVDEVYIPNTAFDFGEYFDDVVGVSVPRSGEPVTVVLKFDEKRYPYVVTKPLHPSQRITDRANRIVQLDVFITSELISLIHSYGEHVEVLGPESLRIEMANEVGRMKDKYNCAY